MSEHTIRDVFHDDHIRIDDLLRRYRDAKQTDSAEAREAFDDFALGLQRHIVWEEELLFPLWEQKTGMSDHGPTHVMRREHRQIASALDAMRHKIGEGNFQTDAEEEDLVNVLMSHNLKEERILYPAIDQVASEDECAEVFLAMKDMPAERYAERGSSPASSAKE